MVITILQIGILVGVAHRISTAKTVAAETSHIEALALIAAATHLAIFGEMKMELRL